MKLIPRIQDLSAVSLFLLLACSFLPTTHAQVPPQTIQYNRDIRPILADHCFSCHGVDANTRKANLRLDEPSSAFGERKGTHAIVPGKPELSELVKRITSSDPEEKMPPPSHPLALSQRQIDTLQQWISEGAVYQNHWAFLELPKALQLPQTENSRWPQNEIDSYILSSLETRHLNPNPEASRATLIRRLSFDLTGLPPSPEEIESFENDPAPNAYEALIDRLLASERYGERMAMWWLDGARYADSHGFQADWERYQWPWRDWVIRAFNENLAFDDFTRYQLAGDLLPNPTLDQRVATGFHRNHRINTEGGSLDEEWLVENVIDRVETTGAVWLGLTLGCARCHDHKYDPISQKEFYQFFAFFHNIPEQGKGPGQPGNFAPTVSVPQPENQWALEQLQGQIRQAQSTLQSLRENWVKLIPSLETQWSQAQSRQPADSWQLLQPDRMISRKGATLTPLEDGSILVSGTNPNEDHYEIDLLAPLDNLGSLLLEVIPDNSFANKSLGRSSNGNFVLSEFRGEWISSNSASSPIDFKHAKANFEQSGWPIANALDGKAETGWAVQGNEFAIARQAVFYRDHSGVPNASQGIRLHFVFQSPYANHAFGRFRLYHSPQTQTTYRTEPIFPEEVAAALDTPGESRTDAMKERLRIYIQEGGVGEVAEASEHLKQLQEQLRKAKQKVPTVMVLEEAKVPRKSYVLFRGQYDQPREEVFAAFPAAFPSALPQKATHEDRTLNRLDLAEWILQNPLTARVQANRLWELLFGVGLVKTSENLGTQAEWPTHPDLLDALAFKLVEFEWDLKRFLKFMAMSATYRQASQKEAPEWTEDPENRLYARGPRFRITAEMIRDQALYISGLLNLQLGGPSVYPYQPNGIWSEFNFYGNMRNYQHGTDGSQYRRSLYTIWKRTAAPPAMTLFDMPNREICTVKRSRTNTPLQALALMNDVTYLEAARVFAQRTLQQPEWSIQQKLAWGFRWTTSRQPSSVELETLERGYLRRLAHFQEHPEDATALLQLGETPAPDGSPQQTAQVAALTTTFNVLMNLDSFITR